MAASVAVVLLAALTTAPVYQHAVVLFDDGRSETRSPAALVANPPAAGFVGVWAWGQDIAPRWFSAEQLATLNRALPRQAGSALGVRVRGIGDEEAADAAIVAAPTAMWEQVPEPLLPRFPLASTRVLSLARDGTSFWRLRVVARGKGSWWIDVPATQRNLGIEATHAANLHIAISAVQGQKLRGLRVAVFPWSAGASAPFGQLATYRPEGDELTIPALPPVSAVGLLFAAEGSVPRFLWGPVASLAGRVVLEGGAALKGRFTDELDRPLPAVAVSGDFFVAKDAAFSFTTTAKTDADGTWALSGLPRTQVAVTARTTGFAPFRRIHEVQSDSDDLGSIRLAPSTLLAVQVADDAGTALAGARLELSSGASTTTDARGRGLLGPALDSPVSLLVTAEGHVPRTIAIALPIPKELGVTLSRTYRVRGRLVDAAGTPVSFAEAWVEAGSTRYSLDADPGGRFEVPIAPGVAAVLVFRSPTTAETRVSVPPGAPGEVGELGDVVAAHGRIVLGRVVADADGAPVAGARVWALRSELQGPLVAWMLDNTASTVTDDEGAFSLAGLSELAVTVWFDAPGYARTGLDVRFEDDPSPVDVGEVRLATGAAVAVRLKGRSNGVAHLDLRGKSLPADMLVAPARDGVAEFSNVPVGEFGLRVLDGEVTVCEERVEVPEGASRVEIVCEWRSRRVTGVVLVDGKASGAGTLLWQSESAGRLPEGIMERTTASGLRQQTTFTSGAPDVLVDVGVDGRFETDHVRPGSWTVFWNGPGGVQFPPKSVVVPDAQVFETRLLFRSLAITGRVVDADARPVDGASVMEHSLGVSALTDGSGNFVLAGMEPGTRTISARKNDRVSAPAQIEIVTDRVPDPLTLSLDRPPQRVSVEVLGDSGPIPAALVVLETDRSQVIVASADSGGRADIMIDPPFPSRIRVAAFGLGKWALGAWRRLPEAGEPVPIVQGRTGSLVLRGTALEESVALLHESGWDVSWLLARLGAPLRFVTGQAQSVFGLPEGRYEIRVGAQSTSGFVRNNETTEITID